MGRTAALVVSGEPGAGKSVLGRELARRLGAALLDLDSLTLPLTEVAAELLVQAGRLAPAEASSLSAPALAGATREARYECLLAAAVDCLEVGTPVVVVAPFTRERAEPGAWEQVAERLAAAGGAPVLVWAAAPAALRTARRHARGFRRDLVAAGEDAGPPAGSATADPEAAPVAAHVRVDTSAPVPGAALDALARRLAEGPPPP